MKAGFDEATGRVIRMLFKKSHPSPRIHPALLMHAINESFNNSESR